MAVKANRWRWFALIMVLATACGGNTPNSTATVGPALAPVATAISSELSSWINKFKFLEVYRGMLSDFISKEGGLLNIDKAVIFAAPTTGSSAQDNVTSLSVPLLSSPTQDLNDPNQAVSVGALIVLKALSSSVATVDLPKGAYLVQVRQGLIHFVGADGTDTLTSLKADIRALDADVDVLSPQTIITRKDICQSWHRSQVCYPISFWNALDPSVQSDIVSRMHKAAQELQAKGLVKEADLDIDQGTLPDSAGMDAPNQGQASLLAAPARVAPPTLPGASKDLAEGTYIVGVFDVLSEINQPGGPSVPIGKYVAKLRKDSKGLIGILDDGTAPLEVPVKLVKVRAPAADGSIEAPMVILLDVDLVACWFGEKCDS